WCPRRLRQEPTPPAKCVLPDLSSTTSDPTGAAPVFDLSGLSFRSTRCQRTSGVSLSRNPMTHSKSLPTGSADRNVQAGLLRRRSAVLGLAVALAAPTAAILGVGHDTAQAASYAWQDQQNQQGSQQDQARQHYAAGIAAYQRGD